VKKGFFDLGAPTSGNIGSAGGKAYYLTALDIPGPVTVRVVADSVNGIRETNELNNERVQSLKPCIRPKLPDLVVRILGPASAKPGQNIGPMIKVTVTNIGTAVALGTDSSREGYMVDIILSSDGILPVHPAVVSPGFTEDMLLEGGRISNTVTLAPGASTAYSLAGGAGVTLPLKINPGKYCLGAVVDPFASVNESREDNNTSCSPIVIK
jgi:subtilase family serine protease